MVLGLYPLWSSASKLADGPLKSILLSESTLNQGYLSPVVTDKSSASLKVYLEDSSAAMQIKKKSHTVEKNTNIVSGRS